MRTYLIKRCSDLEKYKHKMIKGQVILDSNKPSIYIYLPKIGKEPFLEFKIPDDRIEDFKELYEDKVNWDE